MVLYDTGKKEPKRKMDNAVFFRTESWKQHIINSTLVILSSRYSLASVGTNYKGYDSEELANFSDHLGVWLTYHCNLFLKLVCTVVKDNSPENTEEK